MIAVEYIEVDLQTVTDYYAKDFKPKGAAESVRHTDTFVDTTKGKVIYKLLVSTSDQRPG